MVATVSIDTGETKTEPPSVPTDHIERPVNEKPSSVEAVPTATVPAATTGADEAAASAAAETASSDSFLPSFFPTFGASKRTQVWIYASLALIILFCIGLGVYFFVQRQKRLRNTPHDGYEFEMIDDEEDGQALNGQAGAKRRRGGELYNAFAGESDEELLSDEEDDEPYRDRPGGETGGLLEKSRDPEKRGEA